MQGKKKKFSFSLHFSFFFTTFANEINKQLKNMINKNYRNAFLEVAHILVPTATFDYIKESITFTHGNHTETTLTAYGYDTISNSNVQVTTENDPNKGLQMVVKHLDKNGNLLRSFSWWYHVFNWKELIHAQEYKNSINHDK